MPAKVEHGVRRSVFDVVLVLKEREETWVLAKEGSYGTGESSDYPGSRLGLNESGPAAMAGYARRFGAILADWFIATGIAWLIAGSEPPSWLPLAVFAVLSVASLSLLGATLGKMLVRIQVVQVGGAKARVHQVAIRTVLLCLVIPVLIVDNDGRGLHDKLAGTVEITM